jgi:hypothetical protein
MTDIIVSIFQIIPIKFFIVNSIIGMIQIVFSRYREAEDYLSKQTDYSPKNKITWGQIWNVYCQKRSTSNNIYKSYNEALTRSLNCSPEFDAYKKLSSLVQSKQKMDQGTLDQLQSVLAGHFESSRNMTDLTQKLVAYQ